MTETQHPADCKTEAPHVHRYGDSSAQCDVCGYNLPHHETRCSRRGLTPLQVRCEIANMSDADSQETCVVCGRRLRSGGAIIQAGGLAHKNPAICHEYIQKF